MIGIMIVRTAVILLSCSLSYRVVIHTSENINEQEMVSLIHAQYLSEE